LSIDNNACLKVWEGHCKFDNSAHGAAKFLRQNFIRAYYNNRAPYVINLFSDWLKVVVEAEPAPAPKNFPKNIKFNAGKKFYKNLEGVLKFVNETLRNNKDVYFVSAYQAIRWTKHLEYISNNYRNNTNLTESLHKFILNDDIDEYPCPNVSYDGKCDYLKLKSPDYNKTEKLSDINEKDDEEEIDAKTLIELQSEFLYINNVVGFLVIFLVLCLFSIIIYDKFNR
jgi:hypothetical protein